MHKWLLRFQRNKDGESDYGGNGRFLNGEPDASDAQKSEAAGEQNANESDDRNEVRLPTLNEVPQAIAEWENQRQNQTVHRSEALR